MASWSLNTLMSINSNECEKILLKQLQYSESTELHAIRKILLRGGNICRSDAIVFNRLIKYKQEFQINWFTLLIDFRFFFELSCRDTTAYVAEIINTIGQASAAAQGLNQPVTTSDRLRNSDDQVIYLMTEDNEKK